MTGLEREDVVKKAQGAAGAAAWMPHWTMMLHPSAQQTG